MGILLFAMPETERSDQTPSARARDPAPVPGDERRKQFWRQGARAAVERDMDAEVSSVDVLQVFGPMDSDAALLEVRTENGACYQVVAGRDGSFTVF